MSDPLIGMQLGEYVVGMRLDAGAMGAIYRVFKPTNNNPLVVKVMLTKHNGDPQFRKRFEREVALLQSLKHPAIISILDFGEQDGVLYFVMPFIRGRSLDSMLKKLHFSPDMVWKILEPLAQALDYAHDHGVIHRDIKPSNILIDPGAAGTWEGMHPYLADFGLSKPVDGVVLTEVGISIGTPHYMAPEQINGQPVTAATDVYSLGIVLYELLLGRVPFDDKSPELVVLKQIRELPPTPTALNADFPTPIAMVILKALAKVPERRYKTVGDMSAAYWQALQLLEPEARKQTYFVG
jgi:serine/threonine-protein kinase